MRAKTPAAALLVFKPAPIGWAKTPAYFWLLSAAALLSALRALLAAACLSHLISCSAERRAPPEARRGRVRCGAVLPPCC